MGSWKPRSGYPWPVLWDQMANSKPSLSCSGHTHLRDRRPMSESGCVRKGDRARIKTVGAISPRDARGHQSLIRGAVAKLTNLVLAPAIDVVVILYCARELWP